MTLQPFRMEKLAMRTDLKNLHKELTPSCSGAPGRDHQPDRIRDLPEDERGPFLAWLHGQTRPMIEGLPPEEQDASFRHDYRRWKAGLPADD